MVKKVIMGSKFSWTELSNSDYYGEDITDEQAEIIAEDIVKRFNIKMENLNYPVQWMPDESILLIDKNFDYKNIDFESILENIEPNYSIL